MGTVTTPDVLASNGVIHIINEVLVPPGVDVGAYLATCPPASNAPEIDDNDNEEDESEGSGGIDDFLGGIVGDVDNGGGGDVINEILPDDIDADGIGDAVGNFLGGLMEQINDGSGWFGGNGGDTGG